MSGLWLAGFTICVAVASGAAGALFVALLLGGKEEDDFRACQEYARRQETLTNLSRRS